MTALPFAYFIAGLAAFWLLQWLLSPLLTGRGLKEITEDDKDYVWLLSIMQELSLKASISRPKLYLSDKNFPNAFTFGNIFKNGVAITPSLLQILSQQEIKAIVCHELCHIKHRDTDVSLAFGLIPSLFYWAGAALRRARSLLQKYIPIFGSVFAAILLAWGWILIIISFPVNFCLFWFNRLRESYADMQAVSIMGKDSASLATAIAKLEIYMKNVRIDAFRGLIVTVASENIKEADPESLIKEWLDSKLGIFSDLFSTHPHPAKRVKMIFESIRAGELAVGS